LNKETRYVIVLEIPPVESPQTAARDSSCGFKEKMKAMANKKFGCFFIAVGVLVIAFAEKIVFPGLERLVGIETIVGKENIVYQPDGSYLFTNPAAMVHWIASVVLVGLLVCSMGILILIRSRKGRKISN
jgi:hypothetical protein